jgi:hypothetical protein
MQNLFRIETGRAAETAVKNNGAHQVIPARAPGLSSAGRPCEQLKEQPGTESNPMRKRFLRSDWEMLVLWLFVAGIIITSLFAGYLFWAKLSFR